MERRIKLKVAVQEFLVSVIIPVYNVADYLAGCISSVLGQTHPNIEIILVDDGSTDSSPSICDFYASESESIQVIHKENGGLSSARNAGMEIARGDFIMFLDSDDTIPEKAVENLLLVALRDKCDVVIPDRYNKVWPNGESRLCYHFPKELQIEDPRGFAFNVLIRRARAWRATALLYSRKVIVESNASFPIGHTSEDFSFNLAVFGKARKLGFLEETTLNYMQRAGSITKSFNSSFFDTIMYIDSCARDFIRKYSTGAVRDYETADIMLSRNTIVYLISAFTPNSGLSSMERNTLFDRIVANDAVRRAVCVEASDLLFSTPLAGKTVDLIRRMLKNRHYYLAKLMLFAAGRH